MIVLVQETQIATDPPDGRSENDPRAPVGHGLRGKAEAGVGDPGLERLQRRGGIRSAEREASREQALSSGPAPPAAAPLSARARAWDGVPRPSSLGVSSARPAAQPVPGARPAPHTATSRPHRQLARGSPGRGPWAAVRRKGPKRSGASPVGRPRPRPAAAEPARWVSSRRRLSRGVSPRLGFFRAASLSSLPDSISLWLHFLGFFFHGDAARRAASLVCRRAARARAASASPVGRPSSAPRRLARFRPARGTRPPPRVPEVARPVSQSVVRPVSPSVGRSTSRPAIPS